MNKYLLLQLFSCYSIGAFVLPRNFRKHSRLVVNGIWPFGKSNMPSSSASSPPWSAVEFQQALTRVPDVGNRWEDLSILLRAQETVEERTRFEDILTGRGDANHKANIRLFGATEGFQPEVTLYRDTAGWCPYCQKVWLLLEEKRIPYKVVKVPMSCYGDKPSSFLQLNPSGGIPVATIRGVTLSESNDIMMRLESEFWFNPMLPKSEDDPVMSARVRPLLQLERRVFSSWFSWLTSRAGAPAAQEMDALLRQVDEELGKTKKINGGPFFLGPNVSMVDCMFAPFLERMAASLPYYKGFTVRCDSYPNLLRWYEAMDDRPSYRGIKSDYYTHCHDLPPQIGRCLFLPEAAPFTAEIDGGAWSISKSASDCLEPMLPLDTHEACRDAARQLVSNRDKIIPFAMRAVGDLGRPVRASLANPYATPPPMGDSSGDSSGVFPAMDWSLRTLAHALLRHGNNKDASSSSSSSSLSLPVLSEGEKQLLLSDRFPRAEVVACLTYLRDRVGVPRDMSVHGARQLRAHINWLMDHIK